ncbi:hypothetical protein HHK36_003605 [Tetracentron sinense]|uniref:Rab escort protein 1 n=1 Tax=Tetracentron sinense TaxID=13715 RepID=A0A834ZY32_TETSI|nr:hypothetical protein HHK36_003605 [Tetracentron sinense]
MAEEEDISHPSIDPTFYDLIVVGTGLPESIIAAASSAAGKSVLHLDSNSFYGSHFSSLPLDDFASFLQSQRNVSRTESPSSIAGAVAVSGDCISVDLKLRRLYSDIEICSHASPEVLAPSRKFSLDLSGPRVLFCADSTVDLMLKSGASHHIEFKSVDASFVYSGDGRLSSVPDSRASIFKDRSLGLTEKNQLMRFFKLVQEHIGSAASFGDEKEKNGRISEEDLESPFVEFLKKQRLPQKIKSYRSHCPYLFVNQVSNLIILYAIAMADYDQDNLEDCKNLLKTKDGIESLALYHSSVGRFPNALGALIYPIYGQGEIPQAFCRCAAVKGALYVLRMPVTALLIDKGSRHYKGVRLASGQDLFSHQLIVDPSFIVPSPSVLPLPDLLQESSESSSLREVKVKVARGVCITRHSIKPDLSNLLVVFPPRSLYSEQVTSIRALQLDSNLAVCPSGLFVLYLSALCDDTNQGKKLLHAAMDALFTVSISENPENSAAPVQSEGIEGEVKPSLLWSAMYIQELATDSSEAINSAPMPDGNLNYMNLLDATVKMFHNMYPEEGFFVETMASENIEDDGGLSD